jgi:hypothetical protein
MTPTSQGTPPGPTPEGALQGYPPPGRRDGGVGRQARDTGQGHPVSEAETTPRPRPSRCGASRRHGADCGYAMLHRSGSCLACVPCMRSCLGVKVPLSRCTWSRRTREAPGRHREVGSEGRVERRCGARDTNRIRGVVRSGRVGTRPQSPPSTIGAYFINPASMHRRYDS